MEEDWVDLAVDAAKLAGEMVRDNWDRSKEVLMREPGDVKLQVDRDIEKKVIDFLDVPGYDFSFLTEERGSLGDSDLTWVIDPVDGTVNYSSGIPFVSVSIGLRSDDSVVLGVVYDPIRDELFKAVRGVGAFLNGERIKSSGRGLGDSIVEVSHFKDWRSVESMERLIPDISKVRKFGSCALSLAYVSAGRLDGYLTFKTFEWDIAAGSLLVEESGGMVSDLSGDEFVLEEGGFLFSNGEIHKDVLDRIS